MEAAEMASGPDRGMTGCSVVIPTHNRRQSLLRTLAALARQSGMPSFEVVVICDGCSDGSAAAVRRLFVPYRLRVIEQRQSGPAAARNAGVTAATEDVVVFIDDDVVPGPRFLAEHLGQHVDQPDLVVIGPLLPPAGWGSPWVRWEMRTLVKQYALMQEGDFRPGPRQFYTGNASVRRRHLLRAGGFDRRFVRAEDVELAFRLRGLGLSFAFVPGAAAQHLADRSFDSWLLAARQYGRNDVVLGRDQGRDDLLRAIGREYHERHPLTRMSARLAISARLPLRRVRPLVRLTATAAQRAGASRLAHALCSLAFSYQYWRGVADELGGGEAALALVSKPA